MARFNVGDKIHCLNDLKDLPVGAIIKITELNEWFIFVYVKLNDDLWATEYLGDTTSSKDLFNEKTGSDITIIDLPIKETGLKPGDYAHSINALNNLPLGTVCVDSSISPSVAFIRDPDDYCWYQTGMEDPVTTSHMKIHLPLEILHIPNQSKREGTNDVQA